MQTVKYLCHKPVANRHHHQHHINASALPRFWLNLFSVWGNSGCFSTTPKTSTPPLHPSIPYLFPALRWLPQFGDNTVYRAK